MSLPFWRRPKQHEDLRDELQSHLDMSERDRLERGEPADSAAQAARREFGNLALVHQVTREKWGWVWLEALLHDLRYAARTLRGSPLFVSAVVLSLGLGIGANTAIFTLLHASLWKPMPVKNPEEIFHLERASRQGDFAGEFSYSYPLFQQLSKVAAPDGEVFATEMVGSRKFGLDAFSSERIVGEAVSGNFFSALNVRPYLGRTLEPSDDNALGGEHAAVLSHAFWIRRFQGDTAMLGKRIFYEETPYTVVGVADPTFTGVEPGISVDVWVPVTAASADRGWTLNPNVNSLRLLIRLHPNVEVAQLGARLESAFRAHLADTLLPAASAHWKTMLALQHVTLRNAESGLATAGRQYEKPFLVLLAVVAVVLLISCANIANLILARNTARRHEILVRLALGASRARIACQLFIESLILSVVGAVVAIGLAVWGTRLLVSLLPQPPLPDNYPLALRFDLRPDFAVLAFTASLAFVTAIVFGVAPALSASGEKPEMSLRGGGQCVDSRFRARLLLTAQLALSLPLLIGAGLFLTTLHNLQSADLGFHAENTVTFDLSFPKGTADNRVHRAYAEIKERLESHPGVIVASYAWPSIYDRGGWSSSVQVVGHPTPDEDNDIGMIAVGPGFFDAIGLGLLQGRYLDKGDEAGSQPVAVINQSLARHYFGDASPIGQRIEVPHTVRQIVGVVHDAKHYGVREKIWRMVYVPNWQAGQAGSFFVRTNLNLALLSGIIRSEVATTEKILQVEKIRPVETTIEDMISQERLTAILSAAFAGLACLLAAVGLYGVVAYSVSRRTNEFGVRIALGAQTGDIRQLVLGQSLRPIMAGVAIGIGVALALTRALSAVFAGMLYGIRPTDVGILAGATVSLVAIALLGAFFPARRASRVDPMIALRYE
jgi:predicted permease